MTNERRNLILGLLSTLWMLLVFVVYCVTHKPFTPEVLFNLLMQVWAVIVALAIVSLAGGIGRLFHLQRFDLHPLIAATTEAALGLGLISLSVLIIGATPGVNWILVLVSAVVIIVLHKYIFAWWRAWSGVGHFWQEAGALGKWIAALCGLLTLCAFANSFAPTTQFDALTYHLALPKIFIQQGRIVFVPEIMFWGMTQFVEMLYLLAMFVAGANAAHLLNLLVGLMALIALLAFAHERTGNLSAAWVAIASLLSGFTLVWLLSAAYTEWFVIFHGALAFIWLVYWIESKNDSALIVLGLLAGMALSMKYTAGLIALSAALVVLWEGIRLLFSSSRAGFDTATKTAAYSTSVMIKGLFLLGSSAVLIYAPWMIKNFITTRNPFYPIVFPTETMDAVRLTFYQFKPGGQDWSRLLFIPWQATMFGVEGKEGYSASIGALLLGLSPLAWLGWRSKSEAQKTSLSVATMLVVIGFLFWAAGSQFRGLLIQTRLFLSIFPAWAYLGAAGFANVSALKANQIRFGMLAGALIVMALAFNTYEVVRATTASGGFDILMQATSEARYLERNTGDFKAAMDEINALPSGSRVLMLWETRSYYCLPVCDPDEVIDRWYHDWSLTGSAKAVLARWRAQGYTHVLLYRAGADFIRDNDKVAPFTPAYWTGLEATLKLLDEEQVIGDYVLYQMP